MPEEEIVYASHYETKKRINPIIPVVAAIVVIVVVGCIFFFMNRVDFKSLYNKYCSSTWATVGSDGSYLNTIPIHSTLTIPESHTMLLIRQFRM